MLNRKRPHEDFLKMHPIWEVKSFLEDAEKGLFYEKSWCCERRHYEMSLAALHIVFQKKSRWPEAHFEQLEKELVTSHLWNMYFSSFLRALAENGLHTVCTCNILLLVLCSFCLTAGRFPYRTMIEAQFELCLQYFHFFLQPVHNHVSKTFYTCTRIRRIIPEMSKSQNGTWTLVFQARQKTKPSC